jgi:hypothetical protein
VLNGKLNVAITKLMLHNHGYTDKQAIKHEGVIKIGMDKFFDWMMVAGTGPIPSEDKGE